MIEFNELQFGDRLYVVEEKNNSFSRKKITKTDEDGNTWYRYDKDQYEYEIDEIVYCGKVTYTEEGDVRFDEDRLDEYHFRWPSGQIYGYIDCEDYNDIEYSRWFHTRKEAEEYVDYLKLSKNG